MKWLWQLFLGVSSILAWLRDRAQQKLGEQKQVNSDLRGNVAVERAMAEAEVQSQKSHMEAPAALRKGKE